MRYFARFAPFILLVFALWSCGRAGTPTVPSDINYAPAAPSGNSPEVSSTQFLYVPNFGNSTVTVFPKTANGNVSPERRISGPDTFVGEPQATDVDSSGYLYVATRFFNNSFHCCIAVFAPGSEGDAKPIRLIGPNNPSLLSPNALAVDSSHTIWAVDDYAFIFPFVVGQDGNTPVPQGLGSNALQSPSDLAFDQFGLLWVTDSASHLTAFVHGACGIVPPIAETTGPLVNPVALAIAADRTIYVADAGKPEAGILPAVWIFSYPVSAGVGKGQITVIGSIQGPHTGLDVPAGIAVDSDKTIYVASGDKILVYAPMQFGDVTPVRTIVGPKTGLSTPRRLTLH